MSKFRDLLDLDAQNSTISNGEQESVMSGKVGTQSSTFCMLPFMHIYGSAGGDLKIVVKHRRYLNNPVNSEETWNNSTTEN